MNNQENLEAPQEIVLTPQPKNVVCVTFNSSIEKQEDGSYKVESQSGFIQCAGTPSYDALVTTLIRMRYSLDAELALQANLRYDAKGHEEEEKTFQDWRVKCKNAAKNFLNDEEDN